MGLGLRCLGDFEVFRNQKAGALQKCSIGIYGDYGDTWLWRDLCGESVGGSKN